MSSEKAEFDAEVKAFEAFAKVRFVPSSLPHLTQANLSSLFCYSLPKNSPHGSHEQPAHTPLPTSSPNVVLSPFLTLLTSRRESCGRSWSQKLVVRAGDVLLLMAREFHLFIHRPALLFLE